MMALRKVQYDLAFSFNTLKSKCYTYIYVYVKLFDLHESYCKTRKCLFNLPLCFK